MAESSIDIAVEHARLCGMTSFELRNEWRRLHRAPPPMRLSRGLLIRGTTYKPISRQLQRLDSELEMSDAPKRATPLSLKPGTRLVREWHGLTHTVLVHAHGFEWNGRRYRSFNVVAREITGARWSGPRFFGLRKCAGRSTNCAEGRHAQA
jgi:hypothetical protein